MIREWSALLACSLKPGDLWWWRGPWWDPWRLLGQDADGGSERCATEQDEERVDLGAHGEEQRADRN